MAGGGLVVRSIRFVLRPCGYLAFAVSLAALWATASLLGDEHELGFFAGRLSAALRRYPEVTRRGVQAACFLWLGAFAVALTPIDPLATRWDEVVLGALALAVLWHRRFSGSRAER
jgi:hypothetical protein